jgi:hypothetical protein
MVLSPILVFPGTAGAGSLILEYATLSRLTGDDRFEKAAYKAFFALWNRKSDIGLVGNTVNTWTGVCPPRLFPPCTIVLNCILIGMDASRGHWYRRGDRFILRVCS